MSWDLYAIRVPPSIDDLAQLSEDYEPEPFASRADVLAAVIAAAPTADVSDPSWLTVDGPNLCLEVNVGDSDVVDSLMFHVRGGEGAVPFMLAVCNALGVQAYDGVAGQFLDAESGRDSLSEWEAYRDKVVLTSPSQQPSRRRWWPWRSS